MLPLGWGFISTPEAKTVEQPNPATELKRIAIAPLVKVTAVEAGGNVYRCPICGAIFEVGSVSDKAVSTVEDLLVARLMESTHFEVITPDRVGAVYKSLESGSFKISSKALLMKTGAEVGADGIVVGTLYRFRERRGYAYSVEKPASVSFELHLIRVSDGAILWKGVFDKTQKSLMEDVLQAKYFYQEKGRWVTAEELARSGMDEVLKTFPGLQ
jgi:hypothetical protein